MKKTMLEVAKRLLPHIVLCLSVVFLVFVVLSKYNPTMGFLTNNISVGLLVAFCVLAFAESILFIIRNRRGE